MTSITKQTYIISDVDGVLFNFIDAFRNELTNKWGWAPDVNKFSEYNFLNLVSKEYLLSEELAKVYISNIVKHIHQYSSEPVYQDTCAAYSKFLLHEPNEHRKASWKIQFVTGRKQNLDNIDNLHDMLRDFLPLISIEDSIICFEFSAARKVEYAIAQAESLYLYPHHHVILIDDDPSVVQEFESKEKPLNLKLIIKAQPYNCWHGVHKNNQIKYVSELKFEQLDRKSPFYLFNGLQ